MHESFLYEMANQALKGLIAGLGSGSGPTQNCVAVKCREPISIGQDCVTTDLLEACELRKEGSYIIIASKIVAISEKRIVAIPKNPLPYRHMPYELQRLLLKYADTSIGAISYKDAIGADVIEENENELIFSLLPNNPNRSAYNIAQRIKMHSGKLFDVIISDTSAGYQKGVTLIGTPTLIATPIGATLGCDVYYAQRLAVMAEVVRNREQLSPFLIVEPCTLRSRNRKDCAHQRSDGFLSITGKETYLWK